MELYREALQLVPGNDVGERRRLMLRLAVAETASMHVVDARMLGATPPGAEAAQASPESPPA